MRGERSGKRAPAPAADRRPGEENPLDEFLADPTRLDRHPVEIGRCRTVEHWDTGYCYVFSEGRKVSQAIDDRCDNLPGLRDRMLKAIRRGFCDSRAPDPELENPPSARVGAPKPPIRRPPSLPAPGAAGAPRRISIPAFRNDPGRLDRHPMDVGKCRLIEHDTSGDCYIYSFPESQQVSETPDVRCTDHLAVRRSMRIAIDEGHCGIPASERAGQEQLKETMLEMRRLATSLEAYAVDGTSYPVATDVPALAKLIEPKYIGKAPLRDGWGTRSRTPATASSIGSSARERTVPSSRTRRGSTSRPMEKPTRSRGTSFTPTAASSSGPEPRAGKRQARRER